MKNRTIIWYVVKYVSLIVATIGMWQWSGVLITAKSDIQNLIGVALCTGLFLGVVLTFRSDVIKVIKAFNESKTKKNDENE